MQSSAPQQGSTASFHVNVKNSGEGGPSASPHLVYTTLVPISSVFRTMHVVRSLCPLDTINMLWRVKLSLKSTNILLAEFEGGFTSAECGCLLKPSTHQIIWEISIVAWAFAITHIHVTFYSHQKCQKIAHYLWTYGHTHIHTSGLFLQNADLLLYSCRTIWSRLLLSDSLCHSRAFIKA